jgi:hypothetical protein
VEVVTPGHLGGVYMALTANQLTRARGRRHILLPDGTTLVERSAAKIAGRERGFASVVRRLSRLGAPAPGLDENLTVWLSRALRLLGAGEFDHPGNYRYAFRLRSRRQRRRVYAAGSVDGPYPTHRPPPVLTTAPMPTVAAPLPM